MPPRGRSWHRADAIHPKGVESVGRLDGLNSSLHPPVARASHAVVVLALLASAASAGGCGGAARVPKGLMAPGVTARVPVPPTTASRPAESRPAPARSYPFATLPRKSVGPFAARVGDRSIAAWIAPSEREEQHDLIVAPLAADGAPVGQVRVVAHVPRDATSLIVQPGGAPADGWLLAWTALLDRGESVSVLGLEPDGTPRGEPIDLERTSDHVSWAGLVSQAHGAICVWADETSAGTANMLAVALGADGKPRGEPMRIASGVQQWQAVRAGDGAALALVSAGSRDDGANAATLTWQRLDGDGRPQASAMVVTHGATLGSDVDVVTTRDGWLLAWTDRTAQDAQIMLATIDPSGHVRGPTAAMNEAGASALVALASGAAGSALAWQEPGHRSRENRTLHLALVSTEGTLAAEPLTSVEIAPDTSPELVATDSGFALLGAARACEAASAHCQGPVMPTFVRFGARFEPLQTEPLFVGPERDAATLGWGLECAANPCLALAATGQSPTPVFMVDLAARASPFAAPLPALPPPDAPRVTGIATLASGEAYDDVAAARIGDASVVATLTRGTERPHRRRQSRAGRISLRSVDAAGQPLLGPAVLTSHALPLGGIALAAGGDPRDGAAIAWVGVDGDESRVHVARIDAQGHATRELRLTSAHGADGDASNVAIAWAGDGWLVAWVDTRDGNGEVYVMKVDRNVRRVGKDVRITHAPGDASDVTLAVRDAVAWIAWSDPRDNPREGVADIFATTLHPGDGTRAGEEYRVLATARHSRSPVLAPVASGGALVTWIEDAATGLEGPSAAIVARLDSAGRVVGVPTELALSGEGRPTAVAVTSIAGAPAGESIEVVVARSGLAGVTLDAVRLADDGAPVERAWPLIDLDAPPAFDVTFAVTNDGLVFDDVGPGPGDRRVRRASVSWLR